MNIATRLRTAQQGVRISGGAKDIPFLQNIRTKYGGTEASNLGLQRSGREADHSPPSSVEIKNDWS
jgi:hypothetical protein